MRAPAEACARGVNSEKLPNAPRRVNSAILCTIVMEAVAWTEATKYDVDRCRRSQ